MRLLDGGRALWEAENRELALTPPAPSPGDFTVSQREQLRVKLPDVLQVVEGQQDKALIDIRLPDEFSGKIFAPEGFQELAVRAGHIPGAVNIPWKQALNENGTFKSEQELRTLYAGKGIDGSKPIITYCRIGERASHTWFVLSQILGYDVALYDGSWTESRTPSARSGVGSKEIREGVEGLRPPTPSRRVEGADRTSERTQPLPDWDSPEYGSGLPGNTYSILIS